jgi:hypothetical protein
LPAQRTIRRHECHLTLGIRSDRKEGVVTAAGRMQDGDAVGYSSLYAPTSCSFEDHDNGFGKSTRSHRSTNSSYELSGCSWSIPPPAVRPRPDHVRSIDEKHYPSLTDPVIGATP